MNPKHENQTWIRRIEFRPLFTTDKFIYHLLDGGCNIYEPNTSQSKKIIEKWAKEEKLQKAKRNTHCITRNQFIAWHLREKEASKKASEIMFETGDNDVAYARAWFWISRTHIIEEEQSAITQIGLSSKKAFNEHSKERRIIDECQEWVWGGERLALLKYYFGHYGQIDEELVQRAMRGWREPGDTPFEQLNTAMIMANVIRLRIRRYFEDNNGVIFGDNWLRHTGTMTTMEIRTRIIKIINEFQLALETHLVPTLTTVSQKKSTLDLTLNQEYTFAAHRTISHYIKTLRSQSGKISVKCVAAERKLVLPVEETREDLKMAVIELSHMDHVTMGSEKINALAEECGEVASLYLNVDEIQRGALLSPFTCLIYNKQIPENATEKYLAEQLHIARQCLLKMSKCPKTIDHGIFCIQLDSVWETLKERAFDVILRCSQFIREQFHTSLVELGNQFHAFKRVLGFRSMNPSIMLNNKAEANLLCEKEIPLAVKALRMAYERMYELSQLLQFDPSDHNHLIGIVAMRRALSHQIADHDMFFQRCIHIFSHYVRNRQEFIRHSADKAVIKLKVINTFSNPQETPTYLATMVELRPLATSLLDDVVQLNKQEQTIKFPLTCLPEIESMAKHVNSLQNLLEWTQKYLNFKIQFYNRPRVNANIDECRTFLHECTDVLKQVSMEFAAHKTARHFIVQVRNDVEKFLSQLLVLEIVACAQLREWHWARMSEIVGMDLSAYADGPIGDFCALNLKAHVDRLKPITFAAERAGQITNQANYIADYWNEAFFEMESSAFWNVQLPINLGTLVSTAREHYAKIKQFRDTGNQNATLNIQLGKWMTDLDAIGQLLDKWNFTLNTWKRIAAVMQYSHEKIREEFEHFRWCAKYWKRLARFVDEERFVLKLLEGKHIKCWLRLVDNHLTKLIQGVKAHLTNLRYSSSRISLLSDFDFLKLLSDTAVHKKECFPFLREFYIKNNVLRAINLDGEMIEFPSEVNYQLLRGEGTLSFVFEVEKAIHTMIIQSYLHYSETHELNTFRVAQQMNLFVLQSVGGDAVNSVKTVVKHVCHWPTDKREKQQAKIKSVSSRSAAVSEALAQPDDATPEFYIELKENEKRIDLTLDFVPSACFTTFPSMDLNFAYNWSSGKVPFYYGSLQYLRHRVFILSRQKDDIIEFYKLIIFQYTILFRTFRKLSSVYRRLSNTNCRPGSILMVLENFDQLPERLKLLLYSQLQEVKHVYIRLILCSTVSSLAKTMDQNPLLFLADGYVKRSAAGFPNIIPTQRFMLAGMTISDTVGRAGKAFGASNMDQLKIAPTPTAFYGDNVSIVPMNFSPHSDKLYISQHQQTSAASKSQLLSHLLLETLKSIADTQSASMGYGSGRGSCESFQAIYQSPVARRQTATGVFPLSGTPGFSVACCGSVAKQTLMEALEMSNEITWIYFDAFTIDQLMSSNTELGKISSGFLINNFKETMKRTDGNDRSRDVCSDVYYGAQFLGLSSIGFADDGISLNSGGEESIKPSGKGCGSRQTSRFGSPIYVNNASRRSRFVVLYGLQQFRFHFPAISPLFGISTDHQLPGAYVTLPDGSNFYAGSNITFILCLPTCTSEIVDWVELYNIRVIVIDEPPSTSLSTSAENEWANARHTLLGIIRKMKYVDVVAKVIEYAVLPTIRQLNFHVGCESSLMFELLNKDIESISGSLHSSNYSELLRFSTASTAFNFLAIYLLDLNFEAFDRVVQNSLSDADRHVINAPKIPSHLSQLRFVYKEVDDSQDQQSQQQLAKQTDERKEKNLGRWVSWTEEPIFSSTINAKLNLSDTFIIYPEVDRFLTFATRQFCDGSEAVAAGMLVTGPRSCGKTSNIKKLVSFIKTSTDDYRFIWLDCSNRFDLKYMQSRLSSIIQRASANKTIVLIVDNFRYDEPISALLEMYIDKSLLVSEDGMPIKSFKKIKLILIMEEKQFRACRKYGLFTRKFCSFYARSPSDASVSIIMQQIINNHLTAKTFSTEYKALVVPIVNASMHMLKFCEKSTARHLNLAIRLSKALMFAFPDNTPDLDSMLRLWIHELVRILFDSERNKSTRQKAFQEISRVLADELQTSLDKLFTTQLIADDNINIDGEDLAASTSENSAEDMLEMRLDDERRGSRVSILTISDEKDKKFQLDHLLYSELCGLEIMDGIPYGIVMNRVELNRTFENLHFEHMRSNDDARINVIVTDYITSHCQRIMRVARQHAEHLVLASRCPGVGRYQCVRLASFGLIGQIFHIYFNIEDAHSFESCWKGVMHRILLLLASTNHAINVIVHLDYILEEIPHEWLIMFKEWIQNPKISEILSDDALFNVGESIVDCEKALATLLQSSNIRLPGQRTVSFLPFETIRNVETLKDIMSDRVKDLVTFIFMVSNSHATMQSVPHVLNVSSSSELTYLPPSVPGTALPGRKSGRSPCDETVARPASPRRVTNTVRHLFNWCTLDYYTELTAAEVVQMKEKIIGECAYKYKHQLANTMEQIFEIFSKFQDHSIRMNFPSGSPTSSTKMAITVSASLANLHPPTKLQYDFFQCVVTLYNVEYTKLNKVSKVLNSALSAAKKLWASHSEGRAFTEAELAASLDDNDLTLLLFKRKFHHGTERSKELAKKIDELEKESEQIAGKLSKQNSKITSTLQECEEELHKTVTKISSYGPADYKKLVALKESTPSTRLAVEAVHQIIEGQFVLEKNVQAGWQAFKAKLLSPNFYNILLLFDPRSLSGSRSKMEALRRFSENREFKPTKIRGDSPLAADLCHWTHCVIEVAIVNKSLRGKYKIAEKLSAKLSEKTKALGHIRDDRQKSEAECAVVSREIAAMETELTRIRRLMEHRRRADRLLTALAKHEMRWDRILKSVNRKIDSLIGSSIFKAGFRSLLSHQVEDLRTIAFSQWKRIILKQLLRYDEKFSSSNFLTISLLKDAHWHDPWPIVFFVPRGVCDTSTAATDDPGSIANNDTVEFINVLKHLFLMAITVDMAADGGVSWDDDLLISKVHRASQSNCTIIIYNITNSPPAFWLELLNREPNRDTMCVLFDNNKTLHINTKFRLIFVCSSKFGMTACNRQFLEMLHPIIVEEKLDLSDYSIIDTELYGDEENLLKMLNEYNASDILESQELSERIVDLCDSLSSLTRNEDFKMVNDTVTTI